VRVGEFVVALGRQTKSKISAFSGTVSNPCLYASDIQSAGPLFVVESDVKTTVCKTFVYIRVFYHLLSNLINFAHLKSMSILAGH
jgi:hypothetical protein